MGFHSDFWGGAEGKCVQNDGGLGLVGQRRCKQGASLGKLEEHRLPRWQVGDVPRARELVSNVLSCFQLPQLNQAIACRGQGVGDQLGCLGVALSRDDGCLLLLLSLFHHKSGPLRFLLSHLFGFYCFCELLPEGQMCLWGESEYKLKQ